MASRRRRSVPSTPPGASSGSPSSLKEEEPDVGEPPLKRKKRVGEGEEISPRLFRPDDFVCETRAASLMFAFESLSSHSHVSSHSTSLFSLSALPAEIVTLIGRLVVSFGRGGAGLVRFKTPLTNGSDTTLDLECVATISAHRGSAVRALEYISLPASASASASHSSQLLASGGQDGAVKLWDLASQQCVATLEGHRDSVSCLVAFSDGDGKPPLLASGSEDRSIILWDVVGRRQLARLSGHACPIHELVAFRGSSGLPCLATAFCGIWVWDVTTRNTALTMKSAFGSMSQAICVLRDITDSSCVLSDTTDGSSDTTDFLAVGGDTGIKVWKSGIYAEFTLAGHTDQVLSLARFTCEGRAMLVSGSSDRTFRVWDVFARSAVATLEGVAFPRSLTCAADLDGRVLLVVASLPGGHRILDLSTGRVVFETRSMFARACSVFTDSAREAPFLATSGVGLIELWTERS
jgi:WD40 repeat protein